MRFRAFGFSVCVHGGLLAWLVIASFHSSDSSRSLYDREIRPYEHKIIWYSLRSRLPDIRPMNAQTAMKPPRASRKFDQALIAGAKDDARPTQKIWLPEAPKADLLKPAPLPNFLAVMAPMPKPVRTFRPPTPAPRRSIPAAALPEAPEAASLSTVKPVALPIAIPPPSTPMRPFIPPPKLQVPRRNASPVAEAPPAALPSAAITSKTLLPDVPPARPIRKFVPPKPVVATRQPIELPASPAAGQLAPTRATTLPIEAALQRPVRQFKPLAAKAALSGVTPPLPTAPVVPLKETAPDSASLAIASLDPAKTMDMPKPPAPHDSNFSGGRKLNPDGDNAASSAKGVKVPDLLARDAADAARDDAKAALIAAIAPPSRDRLLAAMRLPPPGAGPPAGGPTPNAARVSNAPDPRMNGRVVYVMAIQPAQVTSYSGSWMVWFAEHQPLPGGPAANVRAPEPLREVDPKYIASAMEERVEGVVRLSAVIRKDGHVDSVELLKKLDERLDRSAAEALAKWLFTPALRNGAPVEVDAVFEVPFRLAPRAAR